MPKALYRKYRPTRLEDVVGQDAVTEPLLNSLKQGKISHAYLFIGPRGTGKTSVARILAHAVNNFPYELEDDYLDIIEIDAASNTGVDNIRDLREKAIVAPTKGKYKVYIIDEVHMLSKSAANALLKTVEEPPEHVIFIMATTEANKVPITISSRTQVHTFRLAAPDVMLKHLKKIAKAEKINIEDTALETLIRRGGGSFRDTLSLLDQVATLSDKKITAEVLDRALGLPADAATAALLSAFASGNLSEINRLLRDLLNTGITPETLASELLARILDAPSPAYLPLLEALPDVSAPFADAKLLLALSKNTPQNAPQNTPINAQIPQITPKKITPKIAPEPSKTPSIAPVAKTAAIPEEPPKPSETAPEPPETPIPAEIPGNAPSATSEPPAVKTAPSKPFAWEDLLVAVQEQSEAVYFQLKKCDYEFDGETLHIYPVQNFTARVLAKPESAKILVAALAGTLLQLHEVGEKSAPKDATLSQLSAIMGDVQDLPGDAPF